MIVRFWDLEILKYLNIKILLGLLMMTLVGFPTISLSLFFVSPLLLLTLEVCSEKARSLHSHKDTTPNYYPEINSHYEHHCACKLHLLLVLSP